jgi:hypothetical protein
MALPTLYKPSAVAVKLKVSRRSVFQWLTTGQLSGLQAGQGWCRAEEALMVFMGRRSLPVRKWAKAASYVQSKCKIRLLGSHQLAAG